MITKEELKGLLTTTETFRVERTVSTTDKDKFGEAVCAFANDMPNSRQNGYLLVGVHDDGKLSGLTVSDALLKNLSAIRSDGNILPLPTMNVEAFHFDGGDVAVVEVSPSALPPVRYRGRTWIRVGPRKAIATREEEDMLIQRRRVYSPTFDASPCFGATLDDLKLDLFKHSFLPNAFDEEMLASDTRPIERQLEALCFYSTAFNCPTNAGMILFGKNPMRFLSGDYIQFVRFAGADKSTDILNQQRFIGCLMDVLPAIDIFIKTSIATNRPVPVSVLREKTIYDYPKWSIRELMMNAIMHRDYHSTGPTMFCQFADRLEILNSGGLYGRVNQGNFPDENDYRNPIIADAMRTLGYVNRFGRGIGRVKAELLDNGNGEALFDTTQIGSFKVTVSLTKYAANAERAQTSAESAQTTSESAQTTPESAQTTPESAQTTTESAQTTPESSQELERRLANALPTGIRSDAKANMIKVMKLIYTDSAITAESMSSATGISKRGVQKILAALQKVGLIERIGPDFGGHWEVVGNAK